MKRLTAVVLAILCCTLFNYQPHLVKADWYKTHLIICFDTIKDMISVYRKIFSTHYLNL